jgi:myosin heavy subunit
MSSFSINIFDDPLDPLVTLDPSTSTQDSPNSSFNPSFNPSLGSSSNRMDLRPTSTTMTAPELLPLHNSTDERFKQNQLINGKTQYEQDNHIIKSLEEEIVTMKHKLSFVYEKDDTIAKLNDEISQHKKEIRELQSLTTDSSIIRLDNTRLKDELSASRDELAALTADDRVNERLLEENKQLREKVDTLTQEVTKNSSRISVLNHTRDASGNINANDEDIEEIDELMEVNIPHLRTILMTRLKDKQMTHIESLINSYGLKRTNQVKRSMLEKMLEEAIHL